MCVNKCGCSARALLHLRIGAVVGVGGVVGCADVGTAAFLIVADGADLAGLVHDCYIVAVDC